jgi:hypothetical protein
MVGIGPPLSRMVRRTASGYPAVVNVYLVFGAVEAGFVNLWIIGYAVILLLWGQRGEAAAAHAVRWVRVAAHLELPRPHRARRGALGAH